MVLSLRYAAAAGLFACSLFTISLAQTVDPIVIKGSKFFYKTNGTQFYIRGVAYQQDFVNDTAGLSGDDFVDVLADPAGCQRDIPYLTQLRTNLIRVYAVDPNKDHSECMNALAEAGIYVLADLGSPDESINSNDPAWTTDLYARYTQVIDAFANYTNTFGFFAGNEIVTQPNVTNSAAFAKAAVRDMKSYIKSKNYRPLGVGYATSDNQYIRSPLADYMNCGEDQADAVDFWGYNVYSWCGNSNFEASGYEERTNFFRNFSVPVFFAEYGCNTNPPSQGGRLFTETPVLYSSQMNDVFSGGIVYLYFQEVNNYGLVSVNGDSVSTISPDFNNLRTEIASATSTGSNSASYTPSNSPQVCPTNVVNFTAAASPLPPTPDTNLCECMYNSLGCVPVNNLAEDSYGDLFGYVCGKNAALCAGIQRNGTTGTYGQYGMCEPKQQLGYVLNQYYSSLKSSATACSFAGSAVVTAASSPTGNCAAALSSAATASGGSGGAASSSSKGAGASHGVFGGENGIVFAAIMAQVALVSGIGMILL